MAAEVDGGQQLVVEAFDAARRLAGHARGGARRMVGSVGDRHHRAGALVKREHGAALDQHLGAAVAAVEAPQVRAALLFGGEQQRLAVVFPLQRRLDLVVPFGALDLPALAGAVPHRELVGHRVLQAVVLGQERDLRAVGAVARCTEGPVGVAHDHVEAAALQVQLGQREAVVQALLVGRVVGEHDALPVGRDVEAGGAGLGALELVAAALEHVARAATGQLHHVQLRHAAHRQRVVPVAVQRFAGGVAGFLAVLEFLQALGLCGLALGIGPHPGHEGDAFAVRKPAKAFDAGGHRADAPRFAAVGRDHVELRLLVLVPLLFALGDEAHRVAARAERRLAVLVAALRQRARLAAEGRQQPDRCLALVVGHRVARHRHRGQRAVGRERHVAQALELPQRVDVDLLVACRFVDARA